MARKRYSDEDVLNLLRQIELSVASIAEFPYGLEINWMR
jgi:hypothetical protein